MPRPHRPSHVPVAEQLRDGVVESVHYGSAVVLAADGTRHDVGEPGALFYPRSALKPLQAMGMLHAGLDLPPRLLALAAASHSGAPEHVAGAREILAAYDLPESALANGPDLPYGVGARQAWLRAGGAATRLTQNCSGKHAAMVATCRINDWPVDGYLDPDHPLQRQIRATVTEITGEPTEHASTDGCGTPLFALTLPGLAAAYARIATAADGSHEARLAAAMTTHPEMVAGEDRDVTALMRAVPGAVAKDGFEGVQAVGLPDGSALAVKIADGSDRARMPVTVRLLEHLGLPERLGLPAEALASIPAPEVLGGGRPVGVFRATELVTAAAVPGD